MRKIPLTQGKFTLVDDADYEWLNQYTWHTIKRGSNFYAEHKTSRKTGKQKNIIMHRRILGLKPNDGKQADHIDGNGLNNRRANLRVCTNQQNQFNQRPQKAKSSRFKGVWWDKHVSKWRSRTTHNGHHVHNGLFVDETKAAKAYDGKARELFGEFAHLNFPRIGDSNE